MDSNCENKVETRETIDGVKGREGGRGVGVTDYSTVLLLK